MSDTLPAFLATQIFKLPFVLVCIVAVVLALARYPVQGRSAGFAAWGFGLLLVDWLIRAAHMYWQLSALKRGAAPLELGSVAAMAGSAATLAELAGLILIVLAVFSGRDAGAKVARP